MSSLAGIYCNDLKNNFKSLYATWPPNQPLRLGDFGTLQDDVVFNFLGNIKDRFGIAFGSDTIPERASDFDYTSSESSTIEFHAAGGGTAGGVPIKAGVDISFGSKNSVFFHAASCIPTLILDQVALAEEVMKLYNQGKWEKEFAVVTGIMQAGATTVVISGSSNSSIALEASTSGATSIDLSDASLKLAITKAKDIAFKVITQGSLTPLIGLSKIQGGWFDDDHFAPKVSLLAKADKKTSNADKIPPLHFERLR